MPNRYLVVSVRKTRIDGRPMLAFRCLVDVGGVWVFRGNFTAPAKTPRDQLHTIPARLDSGELNTR